MAKNIILYFLICHSLALITSCNKKDDENTSGSETLRREILTNIGNNIIIPNYYDLKVKAEALDASIRTFNEDPGEESLTQVRLAFTEAYKAWQYASVFEIGPAEAEILRASVNTFPANVNQINNNITSGTYNLGAANNLSAKGFPAIDYLLYGLAQENADLITCYSSMEDAENRKNYLADISADLKEKTNTVHHEWTSTGGNYIEYFINTSGTDVGSSFGELVNELNFDYEVIKNPKVGIPLGKKSLGQKLPESVEAYYSGISKDLALLNVKAIEDIYSGRSKAGTEGKGLDDYLNQLNAQYNGGSLSAAIRSQFDIVKSKIQVIPDPLSDAIINHQSIVEEAYSEIQKMVVLLKTDMPSAMGVLITYQDNDGD